MYQQFYSEVAEEASDRIRQDEQRAFRHSIGLLAAARDKGPGSREAVEALFFLNRLWGVLLEDLASSENALPADVRAKLISIGIWILRYAEEMRVGKKRDVQPLIEISETICKGLGTAA
ncbi:MAG: flagellar biosynthesis regulator FlaF [Proteobacteria bacterium]|nr:flagellar biosynthesis regulator FlaF [Pseudomonadota bacterium]